MVFVEKQVLFRTKLLRQPVGRQKHCTLKRQLPLQMWTGWEVQLNNQREILRKEMKVVYKRNLKKLHFHFPSTTETKYLIPKDLTETPNY